MTSASPRNLIYKSPRSSWQQIKPRPAPHTYHIPSPSASEKWERPRSVLWLCWFSGLLPEPWSLGRGNATIRAWRRAGTMLRSQGTWSHHRHSAVTQSRTLTCHASASICPSLCVLSLAWRRSSTSRSTARNHLVDPNVDVRTSLRYINQSIPAFWLIN